MKLEPLHISNKKAVVKMETIPYYFILIKEFRSVYCQYENIKKYFPVQF